jgi:hypothetical protein
MKRLTAVALVLAIFAGCGGGDDEDDPSEPAAQTGTTPAQEELPRLEGEPTEAKLAKALKLKKSGDAYVSDSGCRFTQIVVGVDAVKAAKAASPKGVITDDGSTYGVVTDKPSVKCLYEAAFKIKAIR